jgi:sulfite reductase alpha subunit-like flavoprotein
MFRPLVPQAFLAVTSTTGMGELPDNLQPLYFAIRDQLPAAWRGLPGAVIGLGDASYGDTFCGGGELMRELFGELGVREVLPMLRLDASESVTPEADAEPWLADLVSRIAAADRRLFGHLRTGGLVTVLPGPLQRHAPRKSPDGGHFDTDPNSS